MRPFSRWWSLAAAWLWAGVWVLVVFEYRIKQPAGELSVDVDGHTYYGHPPTLTIFERDPVSVHLALAIVGAALLVSSIEALVLSLRRSPGRGVVSLLSGVLVGIYSLFGLFWGLASIGVIGGLLFITGLRGRTALMLGQDESAPSGVSER